MSSRILVISSSASASSAAQVGDDAVKRKRGRPKGSKNKPKDDSDGLEGTSAKKPRKSATQKAAKEKPKRKRLSMKAVNEILKAHGIESGKGRAVSKCLRAGILRNKVKLLKPEEDPENEYGLDQVLLDGECFLCGEPLQCTIRDIVYQPDYAGHDYENGRLEATLSCPGEECGGVYVTDICEGIPSFDSGKFHNHCTECPSFGTCLGDYRERHCQRCGSHYYAGGGVGKCYNCFPNFDPLNPFSDEEGDSDDSDCGPNECSII